MPNHALITLTDALRHPRGQVGTRWRRLTVGRQALLVMAHLRKGETYADLATGFGVGTTTVFRYLHEALAVLAALASSLHDAVAVAIRKAFVILDGTLLRIDRVGMGSGRDRPFFSGKHKAHGVNSQVVADPAGRLIWASPALPGARHDMGAAREHGRLGALTAAGVRVIADSGYRGSGFAVPQRRRPTGPDTGQRRRLSRNQKGGDLGPRSATGSWRARERPAQELEDLRKIRCCPRQATDLVKAVLVLMHAG